MRKHMTGVFVAMLGAVALLGACSGGGASQSARTVRVGDRAPGFTLPSGQGSRVSLNDFRGHKPTLLYFSMGPG
jgi:cytochrome oxidase Cu insertion factor (SCO1/SenC/PrrC family)